MNLLLSISDYYTFGPERQTPPLHSALSAWCPQSQLPESPANTETHQRYKGAHTNLTINHIK